MTDRTRIKIAAAVTALFLAGISAIGLAARTDNPQTAAQSAPAPTAEQTTAQTATHDDEGYDDEGHEEGEDDE